MENRTENRSNNCKNQTSNRTSNQTTNSATNEHKHPNQYTKGADDESARVFSGASLPPPRWATMRG